MSTRTYQFVCNIPKSQADALNMESARIYNAVMIEHWRIYRKKGIWLRQGAAEKLNDHYNAQTNKLLHAHSIDAAQQAFYKACKTAKANRSEGAKYPHHHKHYRTTIWKNTGIRVKDGIMLLSLAKSINPVSVSLPDNLKSTFEKNIKEVRLVYDKSKRCYMWHVVIDDGQKPSEAPGNYIAAVDLGEIHPATLTDGKIAAVISCRELRSLNQYTNKRLAAINSKQSKHVKYSRRWWRLQRRKNRFLAQQEQRKRDIEHKISHDVVEWAKNQEVGHLAIGNVRSIANGKRLNRKSQQKISNWSHGKMRQYIKYKAEDEGINIIDNVDERYTSQTCPSCNNRHKPKGRVYTCPACGAVFHRDVVGAANILSRYLYGELGKIPAPKPKYRHPFNVRGKRSPSDTG